MIPSIPTPWEPAAWTAALRSAFRTPESLLDHLGLDVPGVLAESEFPMLVPQSFVARMTRNPADPLLRQVLPVSDENESIPGFVPDPLHETDDFAKAPGLIQKYAGRALLVTTPSCAINCRYCFRRHYPYAEQRSEQHDAALSAIADDSSISEVVLSGGDPLLLPDRPFASLLDRLDAISHVDTVRIHSRIPIVMPERTTEALLASLAERRSATVLVVHANHPNELDADTARAFACYKRAGVWLFNQTVLLRGVNDSADTQIALARQLFRQGALPYYLHMPDPVSGTHHFDVPVEAALALYGAMQSALPGYLVPRLVREIPGKESKTLLREIRQESPTI